MSRDVDPFCCWTNLARPNLEQQRDLPLHATESPEEGGSVFALRLQVINLLWGLKYMNGIYFGLFGAPGQGLNSRNRNSGTG